MTPALLTITSTVPNASSAAWTTRAGVVGSPRSAATATALSPISAATDSSRSRRRPTRTTRRPRAARSDEDRGQLTGIELGKRLDDHGPGQPLVIVAAFLVAKGARARDGPREIVGVGRPEARNRATRLRPRRRPRRVGVCDAAHRLPGAVELEVRRRVRRRTQPFDVAAVLEPDEGDVRGAELLIGHAARLDRQETGVAVDLADVAEAPVREAARREVDIRLEHPPAKLVVHEAARGRRSRAPGRSRGRCPTRG